MGSTAPIATDGEINNNARINFFNIFPPHQRLAQKQNAVTIINKIPTAIFAKIFFISNAF
jgi:hypothetical protein